MSHGGSDSRVTSALCDDAEAVTYSWAMGEKQSARNPACDLCREKKVRCGREKPACHNCRTSSVSCTYSERPKRDNEASRNAHRFEEVYDRLDRIESRLERMESTISRLATLLESMAAHRVPSRSAHTPFTGSYTPAPSTAKSGVPCISTPRARSFSPPCNKSMLVPDSNGHLQYLGPSSLLSITSEAEVLAEERLRLNTTCGSLGGKTDGDLGGRSKEGGGKGAVAGLAPEGRREEMETLSALRGLQSMGSKVISLYPNSGHLEFEIGSREARIEMPPKEVAIELVDEFFTKVHVWCPLFDVARFRAKLDQYYLDPESFSKDRAWLVCFNYTFLLAASSRVSFRYDETGELVQIFFSNVWAAINDVELSMNPRLINVQALLAVSMVATEISRPGLGWLLLSQAARLSQAIGIHRSSNPSDFVTKSELEERKIVFWNVYIIDKSLSLTFGRSPCLLDFDVDVELPDDDGTNPFFNNLIAMIWLAKIQSSIYMRLYSANAGKQSDEDRDKAIGELDAELRQWWEEEVIFGREEAKEGKGNGNGERKEEKEEQVSGRGGDGSARETGWRSGKEIDLMLIAYSKVEVRFSYLCSLTLVHRMGRPGGESERICLESARESIKIVNDLVESDPDLAKSGLLLWLLQYYPFTPFFVLFAAIIRNPSAPASRTVDYPLMQSLVAYLSSMQTKSEGAAKLLQIAEAFTHVAGTFLRNWSKLVAGRNPASPGKRRRPNEDEEDGIRDADSTMGKPDDDWSRSKVSVPRKNFGKMLHPMSVFPQEQQGHFLYPTSASDVDPGIARTAVAVADTPAVDLHAASFLRWPQGSSTAGVEPFAGGSQCADHPESSTQASGVPGYDGGFGMDLEALMAEPLDFQMQMEEAAKLGPLEFDWFSWDGQFS